MTSNKSSQVCLITSREKPNKLQQYQVQKQGVLFLRRLRNKKFRVVFNVVPLREEDGSEVRLAKEFNERLVAVKEEGRVFVDENPKCKELTLSNSMNHKCSYLTASKNKKQLSNNRIIIILTAYLPQHSPPKLLILGYLISSLILYHNFSNQFSQHSHLTNLFCEFGLMLSKTNIDDLNKSIKFKSGYNKTPYFLCLLGKSELQMGDKEYQNCLNQFYRFQSEKQNSKINSALQTIIDYFPERSSLGIQVINNHKNNQPFFTQSGIQTIHQLGTQFQSTILGRQLFNFQFTGTTIQNLLFQMCDSFNSSKQQINLVQMYQKVILNRKSCMQTEYMHLYVGKVQRQLFRGERVDLEEVIGMNGKSVLPVSDCQLIKVMGRIRDETMKEASLQGVNCMNLQEYLQCSQRLFQKISSLQKKLLQLNHQSGRQFVNQCYSILDIDQQQLSFLLTQQQDTQSPQELIQPQMVHMVMSSLINKIQAFSNQCLGMFTEEDGNATKYNETFMRLIKGYFDKLQNNLTEVIEQCNITKRKDTLQLSTLKYELKVSQQQKKRLQQQYQLQLLVQAELKQKVQSLVLESNEQESMRVKKSQQSHFLLHSKQMYRLKRLVEQLQQQVQDKTNHIEDLQYIVDKFQSTSISSSTSMSSSTDTKKIDKFNQITQQLITQANQKVMKLYEILDDVKNVEKQYQNAKKLLLKERDKIVNEKKENLKDSIIIKQKSQKITLENQKLQEIIIEEKKAIQNYKQLLETLKENIDNLETANAELKCSIAEEQGQKEMYRKGLSLLVQHCVKGKSENLQKFYKFLENSQIKQMIQPVVGKK